jgi:hypothetical protein
MGDCLTDLWIDATVDSDHHGESGLGFTVGRCAPLSRGHERRGFQTAWRRTNGLLRQYFPKGTDMAQLTQQDLDFAAHQLNGRPRQTLGWMTPSQKLAEALQ